MLERLVLNRDLGHVDRFKDRPYAVLKAKHRVVLHDSKSDLLACLLFGSEGLLASRLHGLADRLLRGRGRR